MSICLNNLSFDDSFMITGFELMVTYGFLNHEETPHVKSLKIQHHDERETFINYLHFVFYLLQADEQMFPDKKGSYYLTHSWESVASVNLKCLFLNN